MTVKFTKLRNYYGMNIFHFSSGAMTKVGIITNQSIIWRVSSFGGDYFPKNVGYFKRDGSQVCDYCQNTKFINNKYYCNLDTLYRI